MTKNLKNALEYYRFAMTDDDIEAFNELPQPLYKHITTLVFYADKFYRSSVLLSDCSQLLDIASDLYADHPFSKDADKTRESIERFLDDILEKSGGKNE